MQNGTIRSTQHSKHVLHCCPTITSGIGGCQPSRSLSCPTTGCLPAKICCCDCSFVCGHVTESATLWCAAIGGAASQYGKTPIRDELGLNDPDNLAIGSSKQAERSRQARMNSELRSGLANLPKPQNEYEIRVPEAEEEGDEDMAESMEEDAADVAARKQALQKAREEAELRKRSQVSCLHVE